MERFSSPKRLALYFIGFAGIVVALFLWLRRDIVPAPKSKPASRSVARSEVTHAGPNLGNMSELRAEKIRAQLIPLLTRIPSEPEQPFLVPEDQRVIHGMTPDQRREKGFTRMRLFASRSSVRINYLGNALEAIGRDDLAARMKALSKKFAEANAERDEDKVAWRALLTEQRELVNDAMHVALDGETDSKFYRAVVAGSVRDIEDAMSGNLESVDRKIEDELTETRDKDEVNEAKHPDSAAPDRGSGAPEAAIDDAQRGDEKDERAER